MYDFDEIILPRRRGFDLEANLNKFESVKSCADKDNINAILAESKREMHSYKIYDYANDLFERYGRDNAFVKFKQALIVHDPKTFMSHVIAKYPLWEHIRNEKKRELIERLWDQSQNHINFVVRREHERFYNAFAAINATTACLRTRLAANVSAAFKFMLSTLFNTAREGKSIYKTDLVDAYDAHDARNFTSSSRTPAGAQVDVNLGFVLHFRSSIGKYFKHKIAPFSLLKADLDFYAFLVNMYPSPSESLA